MYELISFGKTIGDAGAYLIQIIGANQSKLDDKMDSLDKRIVPPGEYIILDARVFIPVEK
jgi:hypothetical protein